MKLKLPFPNLSFHSVKRLRKYWLTLAFVFGFLVDTITLNRVDQVFDNIVLLNYVILSMVGLLILYSAAAGKFPWRGDLAKRYAPLLVQFAFGGLLSGMLIFYGRSGAWTDSWLFLLIILIVIIGNEVIKKRTGLLIFNLAILFIGLFSYVVLIVPVLTGHMGSLVFIGSGLLALLIMYGFVRLLGLIIPRFISLHKRFVIFTIGLIFLILNGLYFTNIIPPIPLSLKEVGIFHQVTRETDGSYTLVYEDGPWWRPFKHSDNVIRAVVAEPDIYCFAAVFAPVRLSTDIFHNWEYYDETVSGWVTKDRLSYRIEGGSANGFRGFTKIRNYHNGRWRCSIETGRGQVLGRELFKVESVVPKRDLVVRVSQP